jgi:hypothetical protein
VDSRAEFIGRYTAFDAVAPLGLHGGVYLIGWVDDPDQLPDTFIVEATLAIVEHPAWVAPDGTAFAGFSEYRLMDAVR